MVSDPYWTASPNCRACARDSVPGSYLCARCRALVARVETRKDAAGRGRSVDKPARLEAMRRQYDPGVDTFRCHFTGMPLTTRAGTRLSAEWAHLIPGVEASVVLACKLVNRMQTDLAEDDFRAFVIVLARHFEGAPFDERAFPRE